MGMRRILAEVLCAACVPKAYLDELLKGLLELLQFFVCDVLEGKEAVAPLLHSLGEEPEVVVVTGCHVCQGELFFLRQVGGKLHVVGRTFVGHHHFHDGLEETLQGHDVVWEDGLIGGSIAEVFVLRKDVVNEGCAASPMSEDEKWVVL